MNHQIGSSVFSFFQILAFSPLRTPLFLDFSDTIDELEFL
jgi:hypothetical protein